jgi:glucokinase
MNQDKRLVADVGGTNIRIAEYDPSQQKFFAEQTLICDDYTGPTEALAAYFNRYQGARPKLACMAMAAIPSEGDQIQMTNLPWCFSQAQLKQEFGFEQLAIINDFDAIGLSLPHLGNDQLQKLREGDQPLNQHLLAIGPGTGLGGVVRTAGGDILPCEPGHAGLSPANPLELELFALLQREYGEIYAELLVSGPGIQRLYSGLAILRDQTTTAVDTPEITLLAEQDDELAIDTLLLFCALLGSATGDMVTSTGALGGVYLAGGIVPRIVPILERSDFLSRMANKHVQRSNLEKLAVSIISEPQPGLLGAAHYSFGSN